MGGREAGGKVGGRVSGGGGKVGGRVSGRKGKWGGGGRVGREWVSVWERECL